VWGAGAPPEEEGRQWDLIPTLKYSREKRPSSIEDTTDDIFLYRK